MLKKLLYLVLFVFLLVIVWFFVQKKKIFILNENQAIFVPEENSSEGERLLEKEGFVEKELIQKKEEGGVLFEVPFSSQAPLGIWDAIHEESCEEASLIMVDYFLKRKSLNVSMAEKEIQKLVEYQMKKFGDYRDSNAEQIVAIAKEYFQIKNVKVIYDFKKEEIKEQLKQGKIVIVPTAGRLLRNPYYTQPGPLYHNLVLIGYDSDGKIISNDPGTKRGEKYVYDLDVLYFAIHDFPGKVENIEEGRKAMVVFDIE